MSLARSRPGAGGTLCKCPPVRRRRQAAETPSVPNSNGHGVTSDCGLPLADLAVNAVRGASRSGVLVVAQDRIRPAAIAPSPLAEAPKTADFRAFRPPHGQARAYMPIRL